MYLNDAKLGLRGGTGAQLPRPGLDQVAADVDPFGQNVQQGPKFSERQRPENRPLSEGFKLTEWSLPDHIWKEMVEWREPAQVPHSNEGSCPAIGENFLPRLSE